MNGQLLEHFLCSIPTKTMLTIPIGLYWAVLVWNFIDLLKLEQKFPPLAI